MHMESKKDFVQLLKTSFQNEYKISDAQSFSSMLKDQIPPIFRPANSLRLA